ncbi:MULTISPECIES: cytochrome P450 [unclassified Streptomyces]|uniref:cytochrome P450 n=1 Tax=unclassified Streptomyces TaxID=2593676 RepID=UPI0037FF1C54
MPDLTTDPSALVAFPQDRACPHQPPPGYDSLRADHPLSRVTLYDGRPVWLVTGHALARTLLADRRLSSDRTHDDFPVTTPRFADRGRTAALLGVDDPEHQVQRRMVIPGFTVRRVAELRPGIRRTVDGLLDAMIARGPSADLVTAFALPVPSTVICALLGVPYADHEFFEEQSRRLLRGPTAADTQDARERLEEYLGGLVDRKREAPGEGVLDDLVRRQAAEGRPDRAELVSLALVLLVAGHETTANMISLGTYTLLRDPDRLAELRADPALLPTAVEELMRLLSIADGLLRRAVEDIEVAGRTIRAGDGVVFSTSVINRDQDVYEAPDTLDLHRPARHHIAFGFGVHQCLGQNLARAELEIALGALFTRLPTLRLAAPPDEIPFKPGDTIQGMLELPVTW